MVATLARYEGWGEATKQTLISTSTTSQKIDTLGADRVIITVLDGSTVVWVTPDDAGGTGGLALLLNKTTSLRSYPSAIEIQLTGNPSIWVAAGSGTPALSVLHFYDKRNLVLGATDDTVMRIRGWDERMKHTSESVVSGSHLKVDTLGATRVMIVPFTPNIRCYASPTDEGASRSGVTCMRNDSTTRRSVPTYLELELVGNAPLYLIGSGTVTVSVFYFYT